MRSSATVWRDSCRAVPGSPTVLFCAWISRRCQCHKLLTADLKLTRSRTTWTLPRIRPMMAYDIIKYVTQHVTRV